jgi:hypothetical protein
MRRKRRRIDGKRQNAQLAATLSRFLRDEVAHIVQDLADVNDEIRYLCAVLAESD